MPLAYLHLVVVAVVGDEAVVGVATVVAIVVAIVVDGELVVAGVSEVSVVPCRPLDCFREWAT